MRKSNGIAPRHAKQIRSGLLFYELCQQNHLLIVESRVVLTALGMEAFVRLMQKDGHRRVGGLPPI